MFALLALLIADDLRACGRPPRPVAPAEAKVADVARLLHGTWVRRLRIHDAPVETNSFFYFDMDPPRSGDGHALMIDRIGQSGDSPPATTGAYWSVALRPAPADAASRGRTGVSVALAGDYRGTGADYPRGGFRFVETGTFYRDGNAFTTLHPWRAPPQATGAEADAYSKVDAVILRPGGPGAPATLTFLICQDGIVDRYEKVSGAAPTVEGRPLEAAWQAALSSGTFDAGPAR